MGYPSETHLKSKSRENPFGHNLFRNDSIVLKFYTEHDSTTVALCLKCLHDWTTETGYIDKRDFARLCCANRISVKYA